MVLPAVSCLIYQTEEFKIDYCFCFHNKLLFSIYIL